MEDIKKIQEFFSKPLEENTTNWPKEVPSRYGDIIFRLVKVMPDRAKYELIDAETGKTWEVGGRVYGTVNQLKASAEDTIKPQGGRQSSQFESVNEAEGEDQIDTITMDVPLFIRVLEYAREDAQADMDLHDLAEKAIAGTKQQGLLQMDDYDMLVGELEQIGMEENMSLDDEAKAYYLAKIKSGEIDTLPENPKAAFLAQMNEASEEQNLQNLVGKTIAEIEENDGFAYNIKIVFEDGTKFTLDLWKKHDDAGIDWSIKDGGNSIFSDKDKIYEFNYKNYPKDNIKAIQVQLDQLGVKYEMDPKNKVQPFKVIYKPVNKSDDFYDKFDDIVFRYNLKSVVKTSLKETAAYIAETIKLGMMVNEELCEKGKRYIKARQAAGEKSSAYLSGRAVRVCKGQIEWPKKGKKKKTNESLVNEGQKINQNLNNLLNKIKKDFNIDNEQI